MLLASVATLGWSGPSTFSSLARARWVKRKAPARLPGACRIVPILQALGETQGSRQIALGLQNRADVAGVGRHFGVVGAVDLFVDGQGALGETQGSRQIALGLQNPADVAGEGGHIGVVG